MDEELRKLERRAKSGSPADKRRFYVSLDRSGTTIPLADLMAVHPEPAARAWPRNHASFTEAWQACERPDWMLYALCEADQEFSDRVKRIVRNMTGILRDWIRDLANRWANRNRTSVFLTIFNSYLATPLPEETEWWELAQLMSYLDRELTEDQKIDLHESFARLAVRHMEDQDFARPAGGGNETDSLVQIGTFVLAAFSAATSPELRSGTGPGWMYNPVLALQAMMRAMGMVECRDDGGSPDDVMRVTTASQQTQRALATLIRDVVPLPLQLRNPQAPTEEL